MTPAPIPFWLFILMEGITAIVMGMYGLIVGWSARAKYEQNKEHKPDKWKGPTF